MPAHSRVAVICASGSRARQAAEVFARHDVASAVVLGGMHAWASTYDVVEGDFAGATVVQLRRRGKGCLSYVIGAGSRAVAIDPSMDVEQYLAVARAHGWTVTHVLDTHLHADHLSGARALAAATGAALWLNPSDPFVFDFEPLSDGRAVPLADGVELTVSAVSVPGHTEGSTMYRLAGAAIFTGDTVFLESVGRPDLADQAEAFAHLLYRSLHERVLPLGDDVVVFPAHYGPGVAVHAGEFVVSPARAAAHDAAGARLRGGRLRRLGSRQREGPPAELPADRPDQRRARVPRRRRLRHRARSESLRHRLTSFFYVEQRACDTAMCWHVGRIAAQI